MTTTQSADLITKASNGRIRFYTDGQTWTMVSPAPIGGEFVTKVTEEQIQQESRELDGELSK